MSILLALVLLAGAFVVLFDFVEPAYGDLMTAKGQLVASQQALANEQDVVNQAKALLAKYQSETGSADSLALAMPSGPDVSQAIAQLYGIATNDGVAIQAITVSPPVIQSKSSVGTTPVVKPMGSVALQIAATGSYENFKNFLNDLESNIRIFDVTALSLQAVAGGKAGADNYAYNITTATYYQVP